MRPIALPHSVIVGPSGPQQDYINAIEKRSTHYDVFLDSDITEPHDYRDFLAILFSSMPDDSINIYINSNGGHLDTALAIVEGLKCTKAHAMAVIIGACHSAASIIALHCHEIVVLDNAYSMIHTASFGAVGNTGNVKAHTEFTIKQVETLLNETYEGFLTKDELTKVKNGVELWFDASEIRRRLEAKNKLMKSQAKKQAKTTEIQIARAQPITMSD